MSANDTFKVPPSFATFADLDNDANMLLHKWGIPAPSIDARGYFVYPAAVRNNVLERLWSVATALEIGSDCIHEARRVKQWVTRRLEHVDGVLHNTDDGARGGTRCVYGHWSTEATLDDCTARQLGAEICGATARCIVHYCDDETCGCLDHQTGDYVDV